MAASASARSRSRGFEGNRQVSLILDLEGRRGEEYIIDLWARDTINDVKAKAAWRFDIDRHAARDGTMFQILQIKGKGKGKGKRFVFLDDGLRLSDYNVGKDSLLTWTDADEFDECDPDR